jgi:hypothetical protein
LWAEAGALLALSREEFAVKCPRKRFVGTNVAREAVELRDGAVTFGSGREFAPLSSARRPQALEGPLRCIRDG